MKQYPSQERLRELFDYDPDGFLVWKSGQRSGLMAGWISLGKDIVSREYRVGIKNSSYQGNRLVWIFHNGEIKESQHIHKKDWSMPPQIENLYLAECRGEVVYRPRMCQPSGNYKSVWMNVNHSKSWICEDLDGNKFYFSTEIAAATHYDNICEIIHGYRPNFTDRKDVSDRRVTKSIAMYIANAKKSLEDRGVVGVYVHRSRYQARFAKKNLGTFSAQEDAARAYNIAAHKHYGELAILNDIPNPLGEAF